MGRRKLTVESRRQAVPVETQVELVVAWQRSQHARRLAAEAVEKLRAEVAAAIGEDGLSIRDVAAVLGVPPSSVQEMVKPYRAGLRARAQAA